MSERDTASSNVSPSFTQPRVLVPVVLVTGSPDLESAMQAVKLGALLYLTKPIDMEELKGVMARAVRLGRIARLKQEALSLVSSGGLGGLDLLGLEASFERALSKLWVAYQPIVRTKGGRSSATRRSCGATSRRCRTRARSSTPRSGSTG